VKDLVTYSCVVQSNRWSVSLSPCQDSYERILHLYSIERGICRGLLMLYRTIYYFLFACPARFLTHPTQICSSGVLVAIGIPTIVNPPSLVSRIARVYQPRTLPRQTMMVQIISFVIDARDVFGRWAHGWNAPGVRSRQQGGTEKCHLTLTR
jgi:hypothetical protein